MNRLSNLSPPAVCAPGMLVRTMSAEEREEMIYSLFETLPRARLAAIRRKIDPLLNLDIVGSLPPEMALEVLSHLPWQSLLSCSLVSRRWYTLANDNSLWKRLCHARGCAWKPPTRLPSAISISSSLSSDWTGDADDEGMGDEEDVTLAPEHDSGFISMDADYSALNSDAIDPSRLFPSALATTSSLRLSSNRHSSPSSLPSLSTIQPNYKILHHTHTRIHNRVLSASYRLSTLQTRAGVIAEPHHPHTNTIYCLQLYTNPQTGVQTLFTGSKDRTVREWNLGTSQVIRKVEGVHSSSILSLCVHGSLLVSAGSDQRVGVWDLYRNQLSKVIRDHQDSVLGVRFDSRRLVSCSKDRTLRTYLFPSLTPHLVLAGHRAAVNAVAISEHLIVSASGDRSMRVWEAETGNLLRVFENHHSRGIASIVLHAPLVLSGSSDKHIRLVNLNTGEGWSTSHEFDSPEALGSTEEVGGDEDFVTPATAPTCGSCGTAVTLANSREMLGEATSRARSAVRYANAHGDLVRSVVMGDHWVASGSYDSTVKIWNRKTGAFVAELAGGHTGRIFCVGFDGTKVVSVGEDQRICVWDFAHGVNTSFMKM